MPCGPRLSGESRTRFALRKRTATEIGLIHAELHILPRPRVFGVTESVFYHSDLLFFLQKHHAALLFLLDPGHDAGRLEEDMDDEMNIQVNINTLDEAALW